MGEEGDGRGEMVGELWGKGVMREGADGGGGGRGGVGGSSGNKCRRVTRFSSSRPTIRSAGNILFLAAVIVTAGPFSHPPSEYFIDTVDGATAEHFSL